MPTHEIRRPFKRPVISDQHKRRELSLLRQAQSRRDAQLHARRLASTALSLRSGEQSDTEAFEAERASGYELDYQNVEEGGGLTEMGEGEAVAAGETPARDITDVRQASKLLRGSEAKRWFARQLMLPEWMIDVPDRLSHDWYVMARPSGRRCFVVSSTGTTISRLRNGSILHNFPSALPGGSRTRGNGGYSQSYSILDCIFHEVDQTYYVIDMLCWRGHPLYDCTAEFRFFWMNSKLTETGACDPPSQYHRYKFSLVPVYNCDQQGLISAYTGTMPYVKDGLLFYNKHAHYQMGNTPLALVWKDEQCSQYVIDTNSNGEIPTQQQVVLEVQNDGKLTTSDDPPVIFSFVDEEFMQKSGIRPGNLLRFSITAGGLSFLEGKLEKADIQYIGKANRARAFADSYSKVVFQYMARSAALRIDDLIASLSSPNEQEDKTRDVEMDG